MMRGVVGVRKSIHQRVRVRVTMLRVRVTMLRVRVTMLRF